MLAFNMSMADTPEEKTLIEQLYNRYSQMMYKIAFGILHQKLDAEDAVHNTFINLIQSRSLSKLGAADSYETKSYIIVSVKHAAIKIYNKKKRVVTEDIDEHFELSDGMSVEDIALSAQSVEEIKAALSELSDKDYELLYLSAFRQKSTQDIADMLDLPYDTVRKQLYRAKQKLKKKIEEKRGVAV